ncbi:MAG: hypothetical protein NC300_08570 [Bacteroidales bacterium]|nr:beta-hexosaminidase [Clostridium sp.]MCM1204185.1 hypothetical protein [Bacteroidales bacterium]
MRRRILAAVAVVLAFAAAFVLQAAPGEGIQETFAGKKQEERLYGKRIRYGQDEKRMVPGTNLTRLAENSEEEQREREKQEERQADCIAECIAGMTLEEKLAQMMILTNARDITELKLKEIQPGGIIFFGEDYKGKTPEEVAKRVSGLQTCVRYPLFVGVDEEGGKVSRIAELDTEEPHQFKSARRLYEAGLGEVQSETVRKCALLKKMGMNLNFDPVADVVDSPKAYMYERSASGKAEEVAEYVKTVTGVMREQKMGCCLKHFPGYGNLGNTHKRSASDGRLLSEYQEKDFLPFLAGIEEGADMVMVAHIVMKEVDAEYPASLSVKVHALLREQLGFSGVMIADDLNMRAVLSRMSLKQASARAVAAGNDMIFSADAEASLQGMAEAVDSGEVPEEQIDASVARILQMKINLGLLTVEEIAGGNASESPKDRKITGE